MTASASGLKAKGLDLSLEFDVGETIDAQLGIKDGLESFMGPLELKSSSNESTPTDFITNVERAYDIDFIIKSFPSTYGLGSKISLSLTPSISLSAKVSLKSGQAKFFLPSGLKSHVLEFTQRGFNPYSKAFINCHVLSFPPLTGIIQS